MTRTPEETRAEVARVSAEKCHCVSCEMCDGAGKIVWHSPLTMDEEESCEYCDRGIKRVCDRCQLLADLDGELEWIGTMTPEAQAVQMATDAAREKLATFMLERSIPTGHGDTIEALLGELGGWLDERLTTQPTPEGR